MEFTSFKVEGIDFAGASPTRMARLVPKRPKHVWTPPAGRQANPDPNPDSTALLRALFADWGDPTASPGNAHMRRVHRRSGNGFHF